MSDNGPEMDSQTEATRDKKKQKKKRTIIIVTSISLVILIAVGVWIAVGVVGCGTPVVGTYKEGKGYGALNTVITLRANGEYELGSIWLDGKYSKISKGHYEVHSGRVTLLGFTISGERSDSVYDRVGRYLVDQYMNRYRKLSDEEAQRLLNGQ